MPDPATSWTFVFSNIGWAVVFSTVGGIAGIGMVLLASLALPKLVDRLTPDLDEARELARGNVAVAEYFGRVVAAGIIAIGIVIAAAILGGVIAALH